jgi:hypothetical protein
MAPRRGPQKSCDANNLTGIGTTDHPTQPLCFLLRVSQTSHADCIPQETKNGVREPTPPILHVPTPSPSSSPPAHPSNRLIAQLNPNWRVVDDPLQWILQRKQGNPRKKNSGWQDRSFCTTREGLLRCIRDYCGDVEPTCLAGVTALPSYHSMQNLDVHKTDRDQTEVVSKPLGPKCFTVDGPDDQDPGGSSIALS